MSETQIMLQVNPRAKHPNREYISVPANTPVKNERENPQARMLLHLFQKTPLMIFCQHIEPVHPFDHISVEMFGTDPPHLLCANPRGQPAFQIVPIHEPFRLHVTADHGGRKNFINHSVTFAVSSNVSRTPPSLSRLTDL